MGYLTEDEIRLYQPEPPTTGKREPLEDARRALDAAGCDSPHQQMGKRWPVGCVALEITQRCNLDCTLCYLSEHSEAVQDIPLEEIYRRIEMIHRYYGAGTDVQITGGDPTLRNRDELIAIVGRVREKGLRPTLMTNGIRATRPLLAALAAAGLADVAFHVDTTQEIKGYANEAALNEIRLRYLDRVAGLALSVMFNTTVHKGNFHEIPDLVAFFRAHAARIRTASFQLQADTGRGVARRRDELISIDSVARQIQHGAGTAINFGASLIGHPRCSRYGLCLEANGTLYDGFDEPGFVARMQSATAGLALDRTNPRATLTRFARWFARHPAYLASGLVWAGRKVWRMKKDLLAAGGRVNTLSFIIHNFMDANSLERDRIHACAFKTITADGPVSMCLHNAKRETYILEPIPISTRQGEKYWQPLTGNLHTDPPSPSAVTTEPDAYPLKRLKGRTRIKRLGQRRPAIDPYA